MMTFQNDLQVICNKKYLNSGVRILGSGKTRPGNRKTEEIADITESCINYKVSGRAIRKSVKFNFQLRGYYVNF